VLKAERGAPDPTGALVANLALFLAQHGTTKPTKRAYKVWPDRIVSVATLERHFGTWGQAVAVARTATASCPGCPSDAMAGTVGDGLL
jgi:hypothetical protein